MPSRKKSSASTLVPGGAAAALSVLALTLATVASAIGAAWPAVYRDPAWLVPQARGQDVVTLLAVGVMAAALARARRGSARGTVVWLGILGYLLYAYVGAAFAYAFNDLFLLYVTTFSASLFASIVAFGRLDANALAARFDARCPRRPVAAFLVFIAFMLSALWLGQLVPSLVAGKIPESLVRSGGSLKYVFALDLGVIVPLAVLAATWLWRGRPWGYVLAGVVLAKASTMGLALLSMTAFSVAAGEPSPPELTFTWITLAGGSLAMTAWFLAHARREGSAP